MTLMAFAAVLSLGVIGLWKLIVHLTTMLGKWYSKQSRKVQDRMLDGLLYIIAFIVITPIIYVYLHAVSK